MNRPKNEVIRSRTTIQEEPIHNSTSKDIEMQHLQALAEVLESPKDSAALRAAIEANPITISFDPGHPELAIVADSRSGSKEYGWIDAAGDFHTMSESDWLAQQSQPTY